MGLFNGGQWGKISVCTCLRARSINEEVFALIRAKNWGWVSGTLSSTCHFIPFFILYLYNGVMFILKGGKILVILAQDHRGDYKYLWAVFVSHKKIPRLCPNYGDPQLWHFKTFHPEFWRILLPVDSLTKS